jgi:DNA-binding transcriptional MerR regulator
VPRDGSRPLTVGAVVQELAPEFPDITISKVRFLEAEGLVTPTRTAAGYRQFTGADVERLRYVLRAQRDLFWPLKVVREALEAMDRGLTPAAGTAGRPGPPAPAPDPAVPPPADLVHHRDLRLTAAELAEASGLAPPVIADLTAHGLLRPGPDGLLGEPDLQVAHAAAGLAAHGLEGRHLRLFRTAADREVGLVEQAVGPRRGADDDRAAAEVAHLCLTLHAALVRGGLGGRAEVR